MNGRRFAARAAAALMFLGCAVGAAPVGVSRATEWAVQGSVSVSSFYDALSPYGEWISYPGYGWCWAPYEVDAQWRPYSSGHWVYTDWGWTWVSDEPWAWATYHYGRWFFDADDGWVWVPGTVWAPAWVAWQCSDDWVGWAPLPPAAQWDAAVGIRWTSRRALPSSSWCFVQSPAFLAGNLRGWIQPVARNRTLLDATRGVTRFDVRGGRPVNHGVDLAVIERLTRRSPPRMSVADALAETRGAGPSRRPMGFFEPRIRPAPPGAAPNRRPPRGGPAAWREDARQKLETSLEAERSALAAEHQREMRDAASQRRDADLVRRHSDEDRAFQEHAAQQRHVIEQRLRRFDAPQAPPTPQGKPRGRGDERRHGGNGRGHQGP